MSIKLIAIDLDGTLLNSQHIASPKVKESIAYAQDKGVEIILASGRPFSGMDPFLKELNIRNQKNYVISNNGAMIRDFVTNTVVYENVLTYDDYVKIEELSRKSGIPMYVVDHGCLYTANPDIGRFIICEAYLSNLVLKFRKVEEMTDSICYSKCMFTADPEMLDKVDKFIPKEFYEKYEIYKSAEYYLEFLQKNTTKGYALQKIMHEYNLDASEVMCIGDQENDFSMYKVAGTKVAMGNGIDLLKNNATFVTNTNDEDGVATAIYKFI